jgi:uncharacterized protein with beta-barrel porin domain
MTDLSKLVPAGSPQYVAFANLTDSREETEVLMTNTYLRTAEMASSLVRLHSVFADQINDRTRSQLRYREVGYPSAPQPAGSSGWEAMRSFSDSMEDRFQYGDTMESVNEALPRVNYDDVKTWADNTFPKVSYDDMKTSMDKTAPKVKMEKVDLPPSYQIWGRGFGSYNDQSEVDGIAGYEAWVGGGMLGIDREINNVLLGFAGGYTRTDLDGDDGKDGTSDTGHASLYFSAYGNHVFIDANVTYGFHSVDTEYDPLLYSADYIAHTMGLYLGGGYAFSIAEKVLLTPEASILSTYYSREDYEEESDFYPTLKWDSYDEWSHMSSLGATLTLIQKIDWNDAEMTVQPEVRVHWLHEFNDEFDDDEYRMAGGDYDIATALKPREEDLIKVGAGVRMSKWSSETTDVGLDFDGIYGDDYDSYIISGKIMHRF